MPSNEETMRSVLRLALLSLFVLAVSGCSGAPESGPPNMMPNILGALRIADPKERDAALATACREAAEEGSGLAVLMGLPKIEDISRRDESAEECATILQDAGQTEAAVEAAKLLSDEAKREALVAKLKGG
jgi:hypothetical protein